MWKRYAKSLGGKFATVAYTVRIRNKTGDLVLMCVRHIRTLTRFVSVHTYVRHAEGVEHIFVVQISDRPIIAWIFSRFHATR